MNLITQDEISFQTNLNMAKEHVVSGLVKEGYLTEEQGKEIESKYALVLAKNRSLGDRIRDLLGLDKEDICKISLRKVD